MSNLPPSDRDPKASWGEVLTIIRVTFELLALPFLMLVVTLALMISIFFTLFTEPILVVIPLGLLGLGLGYIIRRDKRQQEELRAQIEAGQDVRNRPGRGNLFN